jgi:hypothetical protein
LYLENGGENHAVEEEEETIENTGPTENNNPGTCATACMLSETSSTRDTIF